MLASEMPVPIPLSRTVLPETAHPTRVNLSLLYVMAEKARDGGVLQKMVLGGMGFIRKHAKSVSKIN